MKRLLLILSLVLFTTNVKAQVINYVKYEYQADIKVYFVKYKYEADIIIFKTKSKNQSHHPGYWYMGEKNDGDNRYSSNKLDVYVVKYKYQSDYNVYIGKYEYEIKLNDKYIDEITE